VSKTFPGVQALNDVDLEIASGSVHALLGHNGCGKSTLVKALAGVHAPDPGAEAWIDGEELHLGDPHDAELKGLRFVHQELGIILELGAVDNIGLVLGFERQRGHINWGRQATVTKDLLAEFGFMLDPWQPLGEASPPERAAVAIVRAVAGWEKGRGVLVLDEPTAALPAHEVHHLFRLIREVSATGTAVLLVSHRLDEVMSIADHATVMRAGEIVWDGPLADTSMAGLVKLIADTSGEEMHDDGAVIRARRPELAQAPAALEVTNLVGRYLRGVNLTVRRGEIVGVAGLLGSGREELPYIVTGAESKGVTGTFTIGGETHSELSLLKAQELGVVLVPADRAQEAIFGDFTTSENVSLPGLPGLASSGVLRLAGVRKFSRDWLRSVKADENAAERKITTLSGGNQQKAVLARWLSVEPRVLVLSEPTAGVDIGARNVIYEQLRQRAADGLSVLMASSDVEDLLASCDRVIVLRDGVIVAELETDAMNKPAILGAMEGVDDDE
jgi:ribose transport system ATP-binding protein